MGFVVAFGGNKWPPSVVTPVIRRVVPVLPIAALTVIALDIDASTQRAAGYGRIRQAQPFRGSVATRGLLMQGITSTL